MATLYICEFADATNVGLGLAKGASPMVVQKVTIAATSAQSSALNANTNIVEIISDVPCQWETGSTNPTADTNSRYLPADTPIYYPVTALDKIAVIEQQ